MFYQTLNEAALRRALGEDVLKEIPVPPGEGWMLGGCDVLRGKMWGFLRLNMVKPNKNQGNGKLLPCFYHEKMVVD